MKKILLSLVAMICATMSFAQNTLVATLTHGDQISMYYGASAFINAHEAATHGDVITLSGGKFQTTTITKAITLRGTGAYASSPTRIEPTTYIEIPSDITEELNIEGCRFDDVAINGMLKNARFVKDCFSSIYTDYKDYKEGCMKNCMFTNCEASSITSGNNSSVQILNSYLRRANVAENSSSAFLNCVIDSYNDELQYLRSSLLINCIIFQGGSSTNKLPYSSYAINCVGINYPENSNIMFRNTVESRNCRYVNGKSIFVDSNIKNDLTDEAKATYLGDDGTPVGMYGGSLPFNMTPSYPQITKMNVANRTTADGRLSVNIEISAAQE